RAMDSTAAKTGRSMKKREIMRALASGGERKPVAVSRPNAKCKMKNEKCKMPHQYTSSILHFAFCTSHFSFLLLLGQSCSGHRDGRHGHLLGVDLHLRPHHLQVTDGDPVLWVDAVLDDPQAVLLQRPRLDPAVLDLVLAIDDEDILVSLIGDQG